MHMELRDFFTFYRLFNMTARLHSSNISIRRLVAGDALIRNEISEHTGVSADAHGSTRYPALAY